MPRRTIRPIPSPRPDAVPSILTVAATGSVLDEAFAVDQVGWLDGVQFLDLADLPVEGRSLTNCDWEWLSGDPSDQTPPDPYYPGLVPFFPWEFRAAAGCEVPTPGTDLDVLARQAIEDAVARAVSREVWTGEFTRGHALARDAVELTDGEPVTMAHAFGLILDAVGAAGTWHIPALIEPAIEAAGLVRYGASPNVPLGPGGWPISFGPAYPADWGLVPSPWRRDVTGGYHTPGSGVPLNTGVPLADGETFIIGHRGRIEIAWRVIDDTAPAPGRTGQTLHDPYTNAVETLVRAYAIFRYSPSQVFAARVRVDGATTAPEPVPVLDENGDPVLDENGDPVYEN